MDAAVLPRREVHRLKIKNRGYSRQAVRGLSGSLR
jgi:hypothetical protein